MIRVGVALLLFAALAAPVALPVARAFASHLPPLNDAPRLASLALTTLLLALLSCLVAVPAGVAAALALGRIRVPGRSLLRSLVVVGLFVPLPVYAVAWQVVLGTWLPPLTLAPGEVAWRPWSQGLFPAAWVHGLAALPWVAWITSAALRTADRGLEEDAFMTGGPSMVFRRVLLPRAMLAAVAAAGWAAVQAATEIPVTDAMMVRTLAEEVYTQFVTEGLPGAVAVAVPAWVTAVLVGGWVARRVSRAFDAPPGEAGHPVELRFGARTQLLIGVGLWTAGGLFAGLPLLALVWKAGGGGTVTGWEASAFATKLGQVIRSDGVLLLGSVGSALAAGLVAAGLAWVASWLASGARWFGRFLFVLCVALALTPGPVVGIALKSAIASVVDAEIWALRQLDAAPTFPPLRSMLENQPSPVPAVWAAAIRLFPVAVVILWPAVRAIPKDLSEAAKLDGFGPWGEWRLVVVPLTAGAAGRAVLAVAALALGEVSASKLVNPPGRTAYVLRLFDQMHYGADSTVAALSLLQLALTGGAAWAVLRFRSSAQG